MLDIYVQKSGKVLDLRVRIPCLGVKRDAGDRHLGQCGEP